MDEIRPGYYAIIPADVRYDDRIPANAKLLYGEISALIGKDGFCYASNLYFANLYGMSNETIARLLTKLEKAGHICRVIERDNAGQIITRKLYLKVSVPDVQGIDEKINTPRQKNQEGIDEKVKETNTSITEKESKKRKSKPQPLTDVQLHELVVQGITSMAPPAWQADVKNELYRLIMQLYDPAREVRKARPVRSRPSVDGTFRKLRQHSSGDPLVMLDMLNNAIIGGWQGVQPPNSGKASARPRTEEREYQWL